MLNDVKSRFPKYVDENYSDIEILADLISVTIFSLPYSLQQKHIMMTLAIFSVTT